MIETERLILRGWRDRDRPIFHAHCSDEEVMRYLGGVQTREQTDVRLDGHRRYLASHGYCFWAVERRHDGALIGFCGLKPGATATPIEGEVEIGWRLARAAWGQGYALEAARASLAWGWAHLDVPGIAAITVAANRRSWGLMERLGMARRATEDFDHPELGPDDPLRPHIVYRINRPAA